MNSGVIIPKLDKKYTKIGNSNTIPEARVILVTVPTKESTEIIFATAALT
jgi:hypothetical protein